MCVFMCVRIKNPAYVEYKCLRPCRRNIYVSSIAKDRFSILLIGSNLQKLQSR